MLQVNMFEAKSDLSKLVKMLETKEEDIIYIARNGVEIAQITLIPKTDTTNRFGIAKGKFQISADFDSVFDSMNNEIADLFEGDLNL